MFDRHFQALLVVLLLLALPIAVHAQGTDTISVQQAWARATPGGSGNGAVFLRVRNTSGHADRLVGASADVAERAELHTHIMKGDGVMRMRRIEEVEIPARGGVMLEPGGHHIMLFGLDHPLREGEAFDMTLIFAGAGSLTVPVSVRPLRAGLD